MTFLANKLSKDQALQKLEKENLKRMTVSFYRYVRIQDPHSLRNELYQRWERLGVLGRIYLAYEGINAQFCIPERNWEQFITELYEHKEFKDIPFKVAVEHKESFYKLTLKVRPKIVADGLGDDEYDVTNVGKHLTAQEFHEQMQQKNTIVVDMRNHYESRIGHFEGAICPDVETFSQELPAVRDTLRGREEEKVLLYCTGGIRCEKASAYLKHHGFKDVNQLYGGIIQYAHEIDRKESKFKGKNYVFDERMSERITDDILTECDQCGEKCDTYVNCQNQMCNLLFIQCKACAEKYSQCCSEKCQSIAQLPEEEQRNLRKQAPKNSFNRYKRMVRPNLKK